MQKRTFSFEFFPPKTPKGLDSLTAICKRLSDLSPELMTMTYGTGDKCAEKTLESLDRVQSTSPNIRLSSHLTYIGQKKEQLDIYATKLLDRNIKSIVALRGDIAEGVSKQQFINAEYYQYTNEFISGLKKIHDFEIIVGTYPEKHPDSKDRSQDIYALKKKQEAGASYALTQFFFDNNVYYDFLNEAEKNGINIPIYPGILPIRDFEKMMNFAKNCQSTVPSNIIEAFDRYQHDKESQQKFAQDFLNKQVQDLGKNNIEHIHFYCLNKEDMLAEAIQYYQSTKPSTVKSSERNAAC